MKQKLLPLKEQHWKSGIVEIPTPYLEIYAEDITYFDPMHEFIITGRKDMEALYESLRGQGNVVRYNMINPTVQVWDNTAVLTYNLDSWAGNGSEWKWNCTEVYRKNENGKWEIAHNHWSLVMPIK